MVVKQLQLITSALFVIGSQAKKSIPGVSSFVAPAGFPTSAFSSYYFLPATPTKEPQPAIYDPVLNLTFPYNLTNPESIPDTNPDPVYFPQPTANLSDSEAQSFINEVVANVTTIINSNTTVSKCDVCKSALLAAQPAAFAAPSLVPDAMVKLCTTFKLHSKSKCKQDFAANTFGGVWTQVLAYADVGGLDGQYICNTLSSKFCPKPKADPMLDTASLFPKPKPANACAPKASGKRVKIAHLSDLHLDARYSVSSEANCTSDLCCRANNPNSNFANGQISLPAPPYGSFQCDSPYDLALAALQAVGPLTGTGKGKDSLAWSIYTGDLVSHDPSAELSRAYEEYTEVSVYGMFKAYLTGPVFAALGNHDSIPVAIDAPHSLPGPLGEQQSWNYNHVADLWRHEGWIDAATAAQAKTQYAGYSVKTHYGLRIISLNTDFWYKSNYLNFINTTNPDNSGMLQFLIDELQEAEDKSERVWIIGHVLPGWDGTNGLPNPTELFYQIVERYSPHVIANLFFGHTHEDQFMVYYANNGTIQNADSALMTGWIMPSVTPLTNVNSGFRMYEVDTGDFNIYEAYTFYSDVSSYPQLTHDGPTFEFEYSTRDTYGSAADWPKHAPLNATFWHKVTEAMEKNGSLVSLHNSYQGKLSIMTPNCTNADCHAAKICYMRSGSAALGSQCPQGYGSVQSPFNP